MNQNWDEKTIRQLFLELRREDQRHEPQFGAMLTAARDTNKGSNTLAWSIKFATAAALCVLVVVTIRLWTTKPLEESPKLAPSSLAAVETKTEPVTNPTQSPKKQRHPTIRRQSRPSQFSSSLAIDIKSLSSWQSPTAALLQTPQDEILNKLPRLGESLRTIKQFSPDQFN